MLESLTFAIRRIAKSSFLYPNDCKNNRESIRILSPEKTPLKTSEKYHLNIFATPEQRYSSYNNSNVVAFFKKIFTFAL
jgi:hypothetical protein